MAAANKKDSAGNAPRAPILPSGFWSQLEIQQACREQHFGHLLKSYRELQVPPLKQSELANLLSLTQGQVSRIERSSTPATNLNKLVQWSNILDIPASILWFMRHDTSNDSATQYLLTSTIRNNDGPESPYVAGRDPAKPVNIGASLIGSTRVAKTSALNASNTQAVGMDSVEIMRICLQAFRRIDDSYGGGHSLPKISQYLRDDVAPKVSLGKYVVKVRRELFETAAELYQLAGWSSYDTGKLDQGRKYLSRALQLSQTVDNKAYVAELLAGLSHQHSFLRMPENAVDFALASKASASKVGIHALAAEASVMAAHGYAQVGDKRSCLAELQNAEAEFCRVREGETPEWLSYFDEAYLSAKFGHTLQDLGEPTEAEQFARRSLHMTAGYERGRVLNTALLASTLAAQGQVAEAAAHCRQAVQLAGNVRSVRTTTCLSEVAERLNPYRHDTEVVDLYRYMSKHQIPLRRV